MFNIFVPNLIFLKKCFSHVSIIFKNAIFLLLSTLSTRDFHLHQLKCETAFIQIKSLQLPCGNKTLFVKQSK